ncbi:MAG TPA: MerR family transcriptional regulator [Bacillota bacterium]|nr:MerR family transcriptional regulator [Bacillota bacterium]
MENGYTILQVVGLTGLTIHTLRYYEKIGLIKPIRRNQSGYRNYTERDIAWIKFIDRLRTTGMPVKEMLELAALYDQGEISLPQRRLLLQNHRVKIEKRIEELQNNLEAIDAKIEHYRKKEAESTRCLSC